MANGDTHGTSTGQMTGLTREQAARQLASDGPNELPGSGPRSLLGIAGHVLAEPMFLLLIAASASNLALIFVSRSGSASLATIYARPNAVFWAIIAVAVGALLAVTQIPAVADLFRFGSPPWLAAVGVAITAAGFVLVAGSALQQQKLRIH